MHESLQCRWTLNLFKRACGCELQMLLVPGISYALVLIFVRKAFQMSDFGINLSVSLRHVRGNNKL